MEERFQEEQRQKAQTAKHRNERMCSPGKGWRTGRTCVSSAGNKTALKSILPRSLLGALRILQPFQPLGSRGVVMFTPTMMSSM